MQRDPGKLRRLATAAAVQNQRDRQQSPNLIGIAAASRKTP